MASRFTASLGFGLVPCHLYPATPWAGPPKLRCRKTSVMRLNGQFCLPRRYLLKMYFAQIDLVNAT
jgi:hypothetical protein